MRIQSFRPMALLAFLLLGAGCAPDAVFRVVHPAALPTADYGNTYSIGAFDGVNPMAAGAYRQLVMRAIQQSLNAQIRLGSGNGMLITASVSNDVFDSSVHREDAVCNCAYANGTDPQGQRQYVYQNTPCMAFVRDASGTSTVTFTVTDASSGQTIFSQDFSAANRWSARALSAPNCQNAPPNDQYRARDAPMIDRSGPMMSLYEQNAGAFSRVILPWSENVSVDLEDCDRDARCNQAKSLLRAGNLDGALALYDQILAPYDDASVPVPANMAERVSEALYNRGVVRGYSSDYIRAQLDLERACQMRPDESDWSAEFGRIQQLALEQEQLTRQSGGGGQ